MAAVRGMATSAAAALALACATASSAQAKSHHTLTLKSGGSAVATGTPAGGFLGLGPCGSLVSTGTLTANEQMLDKATFTSFESNGGGCGEGGPSVSGELTGIEVNANSSFTVLGTVNYKTELPKKCEYVLTKLTGKLTLPGETKTEVKGIGKRVKANSEQGCTGTVHVSHFEAELYDAETTEPFEAEAG